MLASPPAPDSLDAAAVVTVLWTEDAGGPELEARDAAHPDREYEPAWTDLARILGTPAPWWQVSLRRTADMALWKPGAGPAITGQPGILAQRIAVATGQPVKAVLGAMARSVTGPIRDALMAEANAFSH